MRRILVGTLPALAALLLGACGGGDSADPTAPTATGGAPATTATATAAPTEQPDAGPNEAFSLEAADGNATLEIPPGALPPGVTPEDVSITLLEGPSEERFAVYRLEPDGMVPLEPLILTVPIDLAVGEGVAVAVTDADGNPVEGATEIVGFVPASDGGPGDLIVSVNHFSQWIIGKVDGHLRIDVEQLEDQRVGATFTVRARVARDPLLLIESIVGARVVGVPKPPAPRRFVGTNDDVTILVLRGAWKASGPVSPSEAKNPEGPSERTPYNGRYDGDQDPVVVEQQFKCESKGDFAISFRADGNLTTTVRHEDASHSVLTFENPHAVSWSAKCIEPASAPPQATAVAPPTPEATAISVPQPPGDESGAGSTWTDVVEGNGVTMTISVQDAATAGQSYVVQVSITGPDGEPLSGEVFCTVARRGDPNAVHDSFMLSSDGTAMLAIQIPDSWMSGDEVALFCFFEELDEEARFITSFFLK